MTQDKNPSNEGFPQKHSLRPGEMTYKPDVYDHEGHDMVTERDIEMKENPIGDKGELPEWCGDPRDSHRKM